jgi:malonyl-CoA O-methyltransferase
MKKIISNNFNKAAASYDSVALSQQEAGQILADKITALNLDFGKILDLGSGTGQMTQSLLSIYPESFFTLCDIAPAMIERSKKKFFSNKNIFFKVCDMELLDLAGYDLIVSNFALQWASNLPAMIAKCLEHAKIFAFTCLLDGTFSQWGELLADYGVNNVLSAYPSLNSLKGLLGTNYYVCDSKILPLEFASQQTFMRYLQTLGALATTGKIKPSALKRLLTEPRKPFMTQYNVAFCIAGK